MTGCWLALTIPIIQQELAGNPAINQLGIDTGAALRPVGSLEGNEMRFGTVASAFWCGVNIVIPAGTLTSMHDSYTPLSGVFMLLEMQLDSFHGGVGTGFLYMFLYIIIAIFIGSLMIGRTPELLGKKVGIPEIQIASFVIVVLPLLYLGAMGLAVTIQNANPDIGWLSNGNARPPGPHGFTTMLYEYVSSAAGNGSGFEGLGDNTPYWNLSTAFVMFFGRFIPTIRPLAIAGILFGKRYAPPTMGVLPTESWTFGLLLTAVIIIIGALSSFPSLAIGPIAEFLSQTGWSQQRFLSTTKPQNRKIGSTLIMKKIVSSLVTLSVAFVTSFGQATNTAGTSATDTTGTTRSAVSVPVTDTTSAAIATAGSNSSGLTLTGYVEAYYTHDFTAPKTNQERPGFLYNHKRNREVNVNVAFIKAAYANERVRGNLAIQVGTYAQYNYAAEQDLVKNIFEANAGVKLSRTKDLWLDAGIFASHIGFESAISKDCWTLTRSLVAENSPYYLSGAKLTYNTPGAKLTLLGMVTNGWQRVAKLPGYSGPSVSTQVQYRPSSKLTLNWSSFLGSDRPDSLQQGRFYNNFYAIINPTGKFGVTLGFDIGSDRKPVIDSRSERRVGDGSYVWYTPVIIARLATSDKSYVAGRIEYYDDKNGVIIGTGTPNGFQTFGYSLNYDYAILPNALFRIEGKVYNSKDAIFETDNGLSKTNTSLTTSLAISF